jgi:hypothetical protein
MPAVAAQQIGEVRVDAFAVAAVGTDARASA